MTKKIFITSLATLGVVGACWLAIDDDNAVALVGELRTREATYYDDCMRAERVDDDARAEADAYVAEEQELSDRMLSACAAHMGRRPEDMIQLERIGNAHERLRSALEEHHDRMHAQRDSDRDADDDGNGDGDGDDIKQACRDHHDEMAEIFDALERDVPLR